MEDIATRNRNTVAFLPWLRLNEPITLACVRFLPWTPAACPPEFQAHADDLRTLLSAYRTMRDEPVPAVTLVCGVTGDPFAPGEERFDVVDRLLDATDWFGGEETAPAWQRVQDEQRWRRVEDEFLRTNPLVTEDEQEGT